MVLRWLEAALDDLRAIKAYIAEENPDAARRVIASIRSMYRSHPAQCASLIDTPYALRGLEPLIRAEPSFEIK